MSTVRHFLRGSRPRAGVAGGVVLVAVLTGCGGDDTARLALDAATASARARAEDVAGTLSGVSIAAEPTTVEADLLKAMPREDTLVVGPVTRQGDAVTVPVAVFAAASKGEGADAVRRAVRMCVAYAVRPGGGVSLAGTPCWQGAPTSAPGIGPVDATVPL
ncbi:MAG: hypothetical protein U0Q15_19420 [Kineosporiaceae bacterium]